MNDEGAKLGIIAGSGALPGAIATYASQCGLCPVIIGIKGEFGGIDEQFPREVFGFGQLGAVFEALRKHAVKDVVFVGGVSKRPDFSVLDLDWKTVKLLPKIRSIMKSGDNALLSGVVEIFEAEGFSVKGIHEFAPGLIAREGILSGRKPGKILRRDIELGLRACKHFGLMDAGQGVVVEAGRIIAIEGAEGTDQMLERVIALRKDGRISDSTVRGVLVKTAKPGQEIRLDLPAIGPNTIRNAINAGLSGVIVEAGQSLILDADETLEIAKDAKLLLMSVPVSTAGVAS